MKLREKALLAGVPGKRQEFQRRLLAWYQRNHRDLPWRRDRDPYRVWLSEIMLQQTRVAAVLDHYKRFLKRFSDVRKLAAARESSVLAAWSGLGYYRRARMLHAAARTIVNDWSGEFPQTAEALLTLPGIGRYTAAAIASISFGEAVAVVDGNVERVLGRLLGKSLTNREVWRKADELLDRRRPGDFNQAMMELGATVCLPRWPMCMACPVIEFCIARGELADPSAGNRQKKREIHYVFDCRKGAVLMVRRPRDSSLMPGMWELPEIQDSNGTSDIWLRLRHSITVTDYVVLVRQGMAPPETTGKWVTKAQLRTLPLTGLARKILGAASVI